jgi:twitching motility protein PilT
MTNSTSQIRTLSFDENEDHPVFGTLVEQVLHLLNSRLVFSDIIIHQNSPMMIRQPHGLAAVTDSPVTKEELEEFFTAFEPNWQTRIADRAFDRAIDLHTARIRANCFTFQGKKRLGCVIRRFPKEPLPLSELGLAAHVQRFAQLTSGLVLIIGDTCQGKSTTMASLLDEINRRRSGHIITIEDPVETLIPARLSIVTQREVGVDGDVESFYLGALDALRERPDVIAIGEIRDAETAQEALALAESGPLVFASLHARSTELGLQKLMRLLGNSEAQAQALAFALRGVLCQALLPSERNNAYHLATECLTSSPEVATLIEKRDLSGIRDYLNSTRSPDCHTMNSSLCALLGDGEVSMAAALAASTERSGLAMLG